MATLRELFEKDIDRDIEGVIKADDERDLLTEVTEYVLTQDIKKNLYELLEHYLDPGVTNGVWISGFFGSGKSHLLKMLALLLGNREVGGKTVCQHFLEKPELADDSLLKGALERISRVRAKSILFNIDQKADAVGSHPDAALLHVFAKVLNEAQGFYPKQDYIAEFERQQARKGTLDAFKAAYQADHGAKWEDDLDAIDNTCNGKFARTYAKFFGESEAEGLRLFDRLRESYKLSVEEFADRVKIYLDTFPAGSRVNFFVDEVGQFIGPNSRRMLNLQTIAESLATRCDARAWVFVTAQGDLDKVIGQLNIQQGEDLSKIQGRFGIHARLTETDVAEVIQKRLLAKKPAGMAELSQIHAEEKENLRTILAFRGESILPKLKSAEQFANAAPFLPYQFDLLQASIEQLSAHDAFDGKQTSIGARSMISVCHHVAKSIAHRPPGTFATFDLMFLGLTKVLKAHLQTPILNASRQLTDHGRPLSAAILKCLFLVKWADQFKATPENVAILLIDHPHIDIAAHEAAVRENLAFLAGQSYLTRNGETYEFLTDEEKDIEVEIRGTKIEESEILRAVHDILFGDIIKDQKFRYDDNGHDYPFTRKVDESIFGREHDLGIHLITPDHPNAGNLAILKAQNTGRRDLLAVLPADASFLDSLRTYEKTRVYTQRASTGSISESRRDIIRQRGVENTTRRQKLTDEGRDLLAKTTFVLNGSEITVSGQEPKIRFHHAFQQLVRCIYPNLRMLRSAYTEHQIPTILSEKDDLVSEQMTEAEQEVLTRLQRARYNAERLLIENVLNHFRKGAYGWYDAATCCLLARLFRRHKIEFRRGPEILEGTDVLQALTNTAQFSVIDVQLQEEFDADTVNRLRTFHQEFFHQTNPETDAKTAATCTLGAFAKEVRALDQILSRESVFPFVASLQPIRNRIDQLSRQDYTHLLKNLAEFEDDLLTAVEDLIDPVKTFIHGASGQHYQEIREFVAGQGTNLEGGDDRLITMQRLLQSEAPFGVNLLQPAVQALQSARAEVNQRLESTRTAALHDLAQAEASLRQSPEFSAISPDEATEVLGLIDVARNAIQTSLLIPVIRDRVRSYQEKEFPAQLSRLQQLANPHQESTSPPGKPSFIAAQEILTKFQPPKRVLQTAADVDQFLEVLRAELQATISQGKGITL